MTITSAEPSPVKMDDSGTIRVGSTRVTLASVVAAFSQGATAEQIAQDYDSLDLADVYGAIAYYLRHRRELDEYLVGQAERAEVFRAHNANLYATGVRDRLIARSEACKASQ